MKHTNSYDSIYHLNEDELQYDDDAQTSQLLPMDVDVSENDDEDELNNPYFGDLSEIGVEELRIILKYMSKGYKVPSIIKDTIFKVAKKEIEEKDKYVIYKRDPNVERRRISSAKVVVVEGNGIQINNIVIFGFGADFDGDSVDGDVSIRVVKNGNITNYSKIKMCDIKRLPFFKLYDKVKKNGKVIITYKVEDEYEVFIESLDTQTGIQNWKKINEYSIHENLTMYKVKDIKNRFENFWVSSDHSMIIYDDEIGSIVRMTPEEVKKFPKNKYVIHG